MAKTVTIITLLMLFQGYACALEDDGIDSAKALAEEIGTQGWIVFSTQTDKGDWDLFLMRPDGSEKHNVTHTPKFNEGGARFSPDGQSLLYHRMPADVVVDNNKYGLYDLVLAKADAAEPQVLGKQYRWASWGPKSDQLAYLQPKGILILDIRTQKEISRIPRRGIVQQLVWSPDGQWFTGTANGLGVAWCIGALGVDTQRIQAVAETGRYNCTPDWWPDSRSVVYSRGIVPEGKGMAQLWRGFTDGHKPRLLVGENDRHLYGGCVSPCGRYLLFTRSQKDLGEVDIACTTLAICRIKDTPMLLGEGDCEGMRQVYPQAGTGPLLELGRGWEPHWTYAEVK